MAAAACSSLCGSLATEVTSRFIRSSMLSCFSSPPVGVAPCAPATARPPTAPSNTQVSRNAALRRALPAASSAFMRNERQLRGTDISCLLHALACGCHPAASCTSGAGGRSRTCTAKGKYDQCSTGTADYVTCSADRPAPAKPGDLVRLAGQETAPLSQSWTRDGYRRNCDTWPRPRDRATTLAPLGYSRLAAARAPCGGAVRDRISGLGKSRPPVACARAAPARGGAQFPVLCTAREHPSNRLCESLAQ